MRSALILIAAAAGVLLLALAGIYTNHSSAQHGQSVSPDIRLTREMPVALTTVPKPATAQRVRTPAVAATVSPTVTPELPATPPPPDESDVQTWKRTGTQVVDDLERIAQHEPVKGHYSQKVPRELVAIVRGASARTDSFESGRGRPPEITITGAELRPMNWKVYGVYRQGTAELLDPSKWRAVTVELAGTVRMRSGNVTVQSYVHPNWNQLTLVLQKSGDTWRLYSANDSYSLRTPDLGSLDPRAHKSSKEGGP